MTREEALIALGINDPAEASAAFRRLSVTCHPDCRTPDAARWAEISKAKGVLMTPVKCVLCKGQGRFVTRITQICEACNGTGWQS